MILTVKNLFSEVKHYLKLWEELIEHLSRYPDDWPKFQEKFNSTLNKLYRDIIDFEKENIDKTESRVYKFKKIFEKRYRHYFLYGDFIKWSLEKPFGYVGDFKIIDDIYQNKPCTNGFSRLWDNYFQQLDISKAVRERKEDIKKIIIDFLKNQKNKNIRIMNLGSGSAREIKELLEVDSEELFSGVVFDCYDFDSRAINYAKELLNNAGNVNFFQKNAIRFAFKKNIREEIVKDYDLIYSAGLFDYLDERIAIRLVANLRKLLKRNGIMVISNVRDKYGDSSAGWMEWVAEWYLIYRTEDEFKNIFMDAGFSQNDLQIIFAHSKAMQYCLAREVSQ